jgi:membrane protein YqaA with SNARE-associated domain
MEQFFLDHGLAGLFFLSFLAATLVPIGSEWLLVTLLFKTFDPITLVFVATVGNFLGACTTYAIGVAGGERLKRKVLRIDSATEERAAKMFRRYGTPSLLLSWLPLVGDALCLAGGIFRVGFGRFSLFVAFGKLLRYAGVAVVTLQGFA